MNLYSARTDYIFTNDLELKKSVHEKLLVAGFKVKEDGKYGRNTYIVVGTADQFAMAIVNGVKFECMEHVYEYVEMPPTEVFRALEEIKPPVESVYNTKCDVHISGNSLTTYNEVALLEDCCTDELQRALSAGWRIITVNAQEARRSDYVLGRYKYHDSTSSMPDVAKREIY